MSTRSLCFRAEIRKNEPRREKTSLQGFQPGPTNKAVQPQEMARGLRFRV